MGCYPSHGCSSRPPEWVCMCEKGKEEFVSHCTVAYVTWLWFWHVSQCVCVSKLVHWVCMVRIHVHECIDMYTVCVRQSGWQTESSSEPLQIDPMSTYHKAEDKEIISLSKVASAIWTATSLRRMDRHSLCLFVSTTSPVSGLLPLCSFFSAYFPHSVLLISSCQLTSLPLSFILNIFVSLFILLIWAFSTPILSRQLKSLRWVAGQLSHPEWNLEELSKSSSSMSHLGVGGRFD